MGGPGSGGRAAPPELHLARGTFRRDRHAVTRTALRNPWRPTRIDRRGLGPSGRRLIDGLLQAFDFDVVEGAQLLEAAHAADQLARVRETNRAGLSSAAVARLDREHRMWSSLLTRTLHQLHAGQM